MDKSHVTDITAAEFPQAVLQRSHEVPVVVDFWAEWCGPCKILGPLLEQTAGDRGGAFELVKLDTDANQEIAAQFGIQSIPTVIAFRDGTPVSRFSGAIPEQALNSWLDQILPTELDAKVDAARDAALSGDTITAENLMREVLAEQPDHPDGGTGLASLLLARGEADEALVVLGKLSPTPEVERLQAAARITAARGSDDVTALEAAVADDPTDESARLDLAKALAGRSEFEPALDIMLALVRLKGVKFDDARQGMLDIFGVLGEEHPLTGSYRRQLANALF